MTVFNKDTIKFVAVPAAKVPLPVSSREKKLFLDYDGVFKTIDANGAIVVFGSTQQVPNEQLSLAALESLNKSLAQVQKQVAAIEPVKVKPEDITNLKSDINKQIEFIEVSLKNILPSLAEQADVDQLKSRLQEFQSIVTLSDKQFIDLKQRLSNSIKESNSNIADVLDILQGKISKQQLEVTVNNVKKELFKLIPEETVVVAGEVTYGTSDEISVREKDNAYIIDLQLKKHRNEGGGWQASGGVSQRTVIELIEQYAPKTLITSSGGTITVTTCGSNYFNIEVAGAAPIITPIAITSFTGGSTNEIGTSVNVNLAWSYNYNPDTSQSLNQGIGSVPLSAFAWSVSTPVSADTTYTLTATDSVRGSTAAHTSVTFINRRYFGLFGADSTLTGSDIVALSSELSDSRSKSFVSYSCSGDRFVFAYPSRLGVATVRDGNGFIMQDWYTGTAPYTINVTNTYGYTEEYLVYQTFNRYHGSPTFLFT